MVVISKKIPSKTRTWLSTGPYTTLDDINSNDDGQIMAYSLLTSYNLLHYKKPKNVYLPWLELESPVNPSSSALDYGEIMQIVNASSSKGFVEPEHVEEFDEEKANALKNVIIQTKFESGEDNAATLLFDTFVCESRTKDAVLKFIQGLFVEMYEKGNVTECVKILTMLGSYSYDDLFPFSQAIALASLSNKSSRVTSAAINMFAHWGNRKALDLLNGVEVPNEPWIKMKYNSVKESLEKRCSLLAK